ncbi:hypothetical protein Droror1_Dr00025463 [Drosera rotundifolia]
MLFPSSLVSSEAAKAGSGASISQPFSDIGEDWGLESSLEGVIKMWVAQPNFMAFHRLAGVSLRRLRTRGLIIKSKANMLMLLSGCRGRSDPVKELLVDAETKSKKLKVESKGQKTAPSDSISCRSSITNSEGTSDAVYPHRLQVLAIATARCHVMKLKVSSIFSPFDLDQCIVLQI